jgi:hypothetical protein
MPAKFKEVAIDDVCAAIADAKKGSSSACVLLGAGASASAGIPLASGFVDILRDSPAYRSADRPTYPHVMMNLSIKQRYDLIAEHVDRAKLNWTHLILAWLMKRGVIGRVLTTNFDNLLLRACAFYGFQPAVYDLAGSPRFNPSLVRDPSVFYLHGQYNGFVQIHGPDESEQHAKRLNPVIQDSIIKRPLIVVGYGGGNDSLLGILKKVRTFTCDLFWVGYKEQDPHPEVMYGFLSDKRQAKLLRGYDSDQFFIRLYPLVNVETPLFLTNPFLHLKSLMETFSPFPVPRKGQADLTVPLLELLQGASDSYVEGKKQISDETLKSLRLEPRVGQLLMERKYDAVVDICDREGQGHTCSARLARSLAWAHVGLANELGDRAKKEKDPGKRRSLYRQAYGHYEHAIQHDKGIYEIHYNWALTLVDEAAKELWKDSEPKFKEVYKHLEKAYTLCRDDGDILSAWAGTLSRQAGKMFDAKIPNSEILRKANQMYELADEKSPNDFKLKTNWGIVYLRWFKSSPNRKNREYLRKSKAKLLEALEIQPRAIKAIYNLGCVCAVDNDLKGCLRWLEQRALEKPPLTAEEIANDSDFDSVRDRKPFERFVKSLS